MGKCSICKRQMFTADGCIEHKTLLSDGEVVTSQIHNENGSLGEVEGSCPDCAAEPGEIHHAYCDWARKPDGSQILIDAVTYWVPFEDQDPRKAASEYLFIVEEPLNPENSESESVQNIAAFLSLDGATNYINNEEENDLEVDVLQILDHEEAHRPNGEWTAHIVIMPPAEGEEYPKVPQNICAHIQKANAVKYVEEDNITPLEIHPVTVKHTS